jgi:hypothetical protein
VLAGSSRARAPVIYSGSSARVWAFARVELRETSEAF